MQEEDDRSLVHNAVSRHRIDTFEIDTATRTKKHFVRRVSHGPHLGGKVGDLLLVTSYIIG